MKTRKKNNVEMSHDIKLLDEARRELSDSAVKFIQEFAECDGDVFFSTYKNFSNKAWEYEREKENREMPNVGDTWDWENKVCGAYRYRDI
tara:strand:+ start:465 stop:734 length:270 start_codon:yes stop_codon:yes gene_type:complete